MERIVLFWIGVVVLLTATVGCLGYALREKRHSGRYSGVHDAIDYLREQRASLEADSRAGLLTPAAFDASVEDLERDALQSSERRRDGLYRTASRRGAVLCLGLFVVVSSWGLYQMLGAPILIRLHGTGSTMGLLQSDGTVRENTTEVVESDLRSYLSEKPSDERAWVLLARKQADRGAFDEAFRSYRRALGLGGKVSRDVDVMTECASVSMARKTKTGYKDALDLFKSIIVIEGESPRICELAAIASLESEDWSSAVGYLEYILASMQGDDTRYERVRRVLLDAKRRQQAESTTSKRSKSTN